MNNDTIPDYGSCIGMQNGSVAYDILWVIYGGFIQSLGTQQGAFFDLQTMDPLIYNEGFVRAASIYKELAQYGPLNVTNLTIRNMRDLFKRGCCAMMLDWANPFSFMAKTPFRDGYSVSLVPGSYQVVNRSTGALIECTPSVCPHAKVGRSGRLLNQAPYAAYGGWSGAISSQIPQLKKQLAYQFLSYVGRPSTSSVDVTKGMGLDMYRSSHLAVSNWEGAGFPASYFSRMLDTFQSTLSSPNLIIDMRLHGASRYQQATLDQLLYQYVIGALSLQQFQNTLLTEWQAITDLNDRQDQLSVYRATIGAPKVVPCAEVHYNFTVIDCINSQSISIEYFWIEPKFCQGGIALPTRYDGGSCDYVSSSGSIGIGLTVASAFFILIFIVFGVFIFANRSHPEMFKSSWVFSLVLVFGAAIMNTFILASVGDPNLGTCVVNIWLLSLGYVLLFGGFLAKMHRIDRLMNIPIQTKVVQVSDWHLTRILLVLVVIDVVLLSVWTWVDPVPKSGIISISISAGISGFKRVCNGGNTITIVALFFYKFLMLLYGALLSFRTRRAPGEFSEQRFTTVAIVVFGFSAVVIIPLIFTLKSHAVLIASLGVLLSTMTTVSVYTMPKLLRVYGIMTMSHSSGSSGASMDSHYRHGAINVGLRSLPASSMRSRFDHLIECPQCGFKFE